MDIFKFNTNTSPTKLEGGEIVNGLKSKMWIERYAEAGEFTFIASATSGVKDFLPIGSLVSHIDTVEVMMVENHEINDTVGAETEIVITGSGLEAPMFENRIVGSNRAFPTNDGAPEYVSVAANTWVQAVALIEDHILEANLIDDNNAIQYTTVVTSASGVGESVERLFKRADLYSTLKSLFDVDNLGIKLVRPGPWSPLGGASPNLAIVIHKGEDRTAEVIFSYDTGDIESADYLWSNKKLKNAALVSGKWVETLVASGPSNFDRRVMLVDASDIDEGYDVAPTGEILDYVVSAMQIRGNEALASQKEIAITKVEIAESAKNAAYRTDYDVGDFITIRGNYTETTRMRIGEYVEIEDETGKKGYPTLSMDSDDVEFTEFDTKVAYSTLILADKPIAYWPLNETNGDVVYDRSGNDYNGTYINNPIVGSPTLAPDGYSVELKAENEDHIYVLSDVLPETGPFTLEAWIKPNTVPSYANGSPAIVTHREDNGAIHGVLGFNDANSNIADGSVFVGYYDGYWKQVLDPTPVVAGEVYHYVGTYDGVTLKLYRNGVQVAALSFEHIPSSGSGRIYIGKDSHTGIATFDGFIDEVAIYNRALPDDRILAHYQTPT